MDDPDMELQAIRQKLQNLKATSPPIEAVANPWSAPRHQARLDSSPALNPTSDSFYAHSGPDLAQVSAAIETLKQRSGPSLYPESTPLSASPATVSRELQRFSAAVSKINALAQQQTITIQGLRPLADQIEQRLEAYGQDEHPEMAAIATFFEEHDTVSIPSIVLNSQGQFCLQYQTIDFFQAERDAEFTAQALRHRTGSARLDLSAPLPAGFEAAGGFEALMEAMPSLRTGCQQRLASLLGITGRSRRRPHPPSRFTLADAAIWFSGAAIARVLLNFVFELYPALWTPLVIGLLAVVAIALYRTLLSARPNLGLSYRILVSLAGLLIGGLFL